MSRRRISAKERVAIFTREAGLCHMCKGAVTVGQAWDISHDIPLELGGADEGENLKVAHRTCHRDHTAAVDAPAIAKAKRREAAHMGAKTAPSKKIESAGFAPAAKQLKASKPIEKLAALPRRAMFY
jgi:5-methylcytosine-specific restriction protein A